MLAAVAGVLRRQLRDVDQAFRLEEDEFAILAPHTEAAGLVPMATRIAELIASSQADEGPRIAIAAGVVDLPRPTGRAPSACWRAPPRRPTRRRRRGSPVGRSPAAPADGPCKIRSGARQSL